MKLIKNQNGFTLIELIIVIAILAIIAAIAIPNIVGSIDDSKKATDVASGKIIADAVSRVLALEGEYSGFETAALDVRTLNGNFVEGAPYDDDFQADLYIALNESIPEPKYKGTGVTADNYIVRVTGGRIIDVYIGSGSDVSTANALKIYPQPDAQYND